MYNINLVLPENTLWLMYSSEQSDKYFGKYISNTIISSSLAIISNKKTVVLVHELDNQNVPENFEKIVYRDSQEFKDALEKVLNECDFVDKIALNFSDDSSLDILRTWYVYIFD